MSIEKTAQIEGLIKALRPFANAGARIIHYGEPNIATQIVALDEDIIYELHAVDKDLHNAPDELLIVKHLLEAAKIMQEVEE